MKFTMTSRDLKDYILALCIVKYQQPLFSLDGELNLHPEIVKAHEILEQAHAQAKPYRGQRKVKFDIPTELQTNNLNKALRYGFEQSMLFDHPKRGLTILTKPILWQWQTILLQRGTSKWQFASWLYYPLSTTKTWGDMT